VLRITPDDTGDRLRHLGRADLLLLDAEVFDDNVAIALASVRNRHPRLPVMLLASADSEARAVLAAIRTGITQLVDPDEPMSIDVVRGAIEAKPGSERALAIGAHPDDVEIGCAGTLLADGARGDLITVLTLSRGSVGGTADQRRREARSASSAMSAQLMVADFIDTEIHTDPDLIRVSSTSWFRSARGRSTSTPRTTPIKITGLSTSRP
jgi:two-component system, NtrC family, response regulator HydG